MNLLFFSHLFPNTVSPIKGVFMQSKMLALKEYTDISPTVISPIPYVPRFLGSRSKKWQEYRATEKKGSVSGIEVFYPRYLRLPGNWFRKFEGLSMFLFSLPTILTLSKRIKFDFVLGGNFSEDSVAAFFIGKVLGLKAGSYAIGSDVNIYPFESKVLMAITRFLLKRLDLVICVGKGLKKNVEQTIGRYKSLDYNYLGVELDDFDYIPNKQNENPKGLYVGTIVSSKGIFDLIEAVSLIDKNKDFEISVVGSGTEENVRKMKEQISGESRIQYLGRVAHSEISKLFNASDFFIAPTYSEGCCCALTEAAASGLPLLMTDIPQNIDSMGPNALTFEKGDIEGIREAIETFLDLGQDKKTIMAEASRKLAEENFDDKKAAIHFKSILESIPGRTL